MTASRSAWRANDVVAYDGLRAACNTAVALLIRLSNEDAIRRIEALSEAATIRRQTLEVDGFDRAATDAARASLDARIAELLGRLS